MTTEPNEAALKLARKVSDETLLRIAVDRYCSPRLARIIDEAALAAILETTERAVKFNDRHAWEWSIGTMNASLRNMEHLA